MWIIVEHQKDFPSLCHVSSLVRIIHVFSVCFFRSWISYYYHHYHYDYVQLLIYLYICSFSQFQWREINLIIQTKMKENAKKIFVFVGGKPKEKRRMTKNVYEEKSNARFFSFGFLVFILFRSCIVSFSKLFIVIW